MSLSEKATTRVDASTIDVSHPINELDGWQYSPCVEELYQEPEFFSHPHRVPTFLTVMLEFFSDDNWSAADFQIDQ